MQYSLTLSSLSEVADDVISGVTVSEVAVVVRVKLDDSRSNRY